MQQASLNKIEQSVKKAQNELDVLKRQIVQVDYFAHVWFSSFIWLLTHLHVSAAKLNIGIPVIQFMIGASKSHLINYISTYHWCDF